MHNAPRKSAYSTTTPKTMSLWQFESVLTNTTWWAAEMMEEAKIGIRP
jgi:hypothetical protein